MYYILDGKNTVACDVATWASSFENRDAWTVNKTTIGDANISTVFLGIDHSLGGARPMLFETMVFGGPIDEAMDRCTTWEEAVEMHKLMCYRVEMAGHSDGGAMTTV